MSRRAAYDEIGLGYGAFRKPDPRIARMIDAALGDARTILDVGAGTGSYEPAGREVVAIEPSPVMISQRAQMLALSDPSRVEEGIRRLSSDLASGEWTRRHRDLLQQDSVDGGYRIVVAGQASRPACAPVRRPARR
jgi:hypothetical protein